MTIAIETTAPAAPPLSVVIFGLDESGKAHASAFAQPEAERAEKAAGLMNMHAMAIVDDERRALAAKLPKGRLFESGRAFAPFVSRSIFDKLCALGGHPVIAAQPAKPRTAAAPPTVTSAPTGAEPTLPLHWSAIRVRSLVLATTGGEGDGWFESEVIEDKGDSLFVLRWRDWPEDGVFLRRRDQLALLPLADTKGTPAKA